MYQKENKNASPNNSGITKNEYIFFSFLETCKMNIGNIQAANAKLYLPLLKKIKNEPINSRTMFLRSLFCIYFKFKMNAKNRMKQTQICK